MHFLVLFWRFLFFFLFFSVVTEKDKKKLVLTQKLMILTSEPRSEPPFAGLNTQQVVIELKKLSCQDITFQVL